MCSYVLMNVNCNTGDPTNFVEAFSIVAWLLVLMMAVRTLPLLVILCVITGPFRSENAELAGDEREIPPGVPLGFPARGGSYN